MSPTTFERRCTLVSGAVFMLALAACSGSENEGHPGPSDGGASAGGSGGGGSVGGSSGDGSGNASGGGAVPGGISPSVIAKTCGASAVARPQLRRLTAAELQHSLDDVFPQIKGKWSADLSEVESKLGFDNDPTVLTAGGQVVEKLLGSAERLATALVADDALQQVLPCSSTDKSRGCAQSFVDKLGPRLFRRPLSATEQQRYLAFFDARLAATDFKSALRWLTVALVQSPQAIYRREVGTNAGGQYQLTQHEIATELAYAYGGSTPSAELLKKADEGTLNTPEARLAVAKQLLATPAGQEAMQNFFSSWLSYDHVPSTIGTVPEYAAVAGNMVEETRAFVREVALNGSGGIAELLTANYTTPSSSLAKFYGFPAPSADYAKVPRPAGRGLGILAQGSIIAAHSHMDASSPTLRGLVVFERLLCGERPQVPPNVPALPAAVEAHTTRERYEKVHARAPVCVACHSRFDPLGFAFEHYDQAGRYREQENNYPIDTTGSVTAGADAPFEFDGVDDLATKLGAQKKVAECVSGYLSAYAFANDVACLGETRRSEFTAGQIGFTEYYASLAAEPSFATRK